MPDTAAGTESIADAALLEALLDVYRHLDLAEQVQVLAEHALEWSGLPIALRFALGDEAGQLALLSDSLPGMTEPGVAGVELAAVEAELGDRRDMLYDGLPPFVVRESQAPRNLPPRSWAIGIRAESGATAGLLVLLGEEDPTEPMRERIRRLVHGARGAVRNALSIRETRELVFRDDTANCYNRRYFNEFLIEEMARATRFRSPLSLIFFDMDNLKEVNSKHGHAMGSRTLMEVSERVRGKVRRFDKLFRFGGDEFCIILPETEWHGALEVAERVRESIAGKAMLTEEIGQRGVRMTASFGIASFPLHARTREELIQRADRAMQRIKRGTKNSIAIAEVTKPGTSRQEA